MNALAKIPEVLPAGFVRITNVPAVLLRDAVPPERHGDLLGSLLCEIGRDGQRTVEDLRSYAISAVSITYRSPWTALGLERIFDGEIPERAKTPVWGRAVSFLAALCYGQTGMWPELCNVFLYRDGRDFLPWHIDSEAVYGPGAAKMFAATYSFGQPRRVEWKPLMCGPDYDDVSRPEVGFAPPSGSLYVMDPDTQRRFVHRVAPGEDGDMFGPRVGVTFFVGQKASAALLPYVLVGRGEPLVVGSFDDVRLAYETLRDRDDYGDFGFMLPTGKMTSFPPEVTACARRLGHLEEGKGRTRTRRSKAKEIPKSRIEKVRRRKP